MNVIPPMVRVLRGMIGCLHRFTSAACSLRLVNDRQSARSCRSAGLGTMQIRQSWWTLSRATIWSRTFLTRHRLLPPLFGLLSQSVILFGDLEKVHSRLAICDVVKLCACLCCTFAPIFWIANWIGHVTRPLHQHKPSRDRAFPVVS